MLKNKIEILRQEYNLYLSYLEDYVNMVRPDLIEVTDLTNRWEQLLEAINDNPKGSKWQLMTINKYRASIRNQTKYFKKQLNLL